MSGQIIATARWRALDREGEDTCRLSHADHGWLLMGHARFRDAGVIAALNYVVRCDEAWRTLGADIAGMHGEREVQLRITRDRGHWLLNETAQPDVEDATDLDLSFTPATNLMPLRRLMVSRNTGLNVTAAWLRYPEVGLTRLDQAYGRTGLPDVASYSAQQTEFATQLGFDSSGFVTRYPELWEGEVQHAA